MIEIAPLAPAADQLVSVGLPVHNGSASLALALDSLIGQDHANLEIVIADNASSDETRAICSDYAARDARIRYIRREVAAEPQNNFRFVFEQTRGDFFCWASHDDLRNPRYVSSLLAAFRERPSAVLAVPRVVSFSDHERYLAGEALCEQPPPQSLTGLGFRERHEILVTNGACQIYGLIRSAALRLYPWPRIPYGFDLMMLHYLAELGEVVASPEAIFYYYSPLDRPVHITLQYRWFGKNLSVKLPRIPYVRWARVAATELARVRRARGFPTTAVQLFPWLCFVHLGGPAIWARQALYDSAGGRGQSLWRGIRRLIRRPEAARRSPGR